MLANRLEKFIDSLGLAVSAFEIKIGVGNGTVGKAIKSNGVGSKVLEKIFSEYPELSFDWLITGRGDMLIESAENKVAVQEKNPTTNNIFKAHPKLKSNRIVPILDAKAAAGDPYVFDHPDYFRKLDSFTFPATMFPPGKYASIQVRGDSMTETLYAGDFVIGREIENLTQFKAGDIYIIIYQEDSRPHFVVKRCYYYLGDDDISLRSDNPLDKHQDFFLPVSSLMKAYHVVGRFTTTISRANGNMISSVERIEGRLRNIEDRLD